MTKLLYFINEHKFDLVLIILFLLSISIICVFILNTIDVIQEAGGIRGIIVDVGKEIKAIGNDINNGQH